jgi:choline dehydrogenase-like flavoprotein
MSQPEYDIVTVGGGLGGSALAMAMAQQGARVLVLEQEKRFRDRVRGEGILPWGVEEMRRLGIYDRLRDRCGRQCRYLVTSLDFTTASHRRSAKAPGWRVVTSSRPHRSTRTSPSSIRRCRRRYSLPLPTRVPRYFAALQSRRSHRALPARSD